MMGLWLLILLSMLAVSTFGNEAVIDSLGEVQMDGEQPPVNETLVQELIAASGEKPTRISEASARDIALMIAEMKVDHEAQTMLNEMEEGTTVMEFEDMDGMSHAQKVFELAATVSGIKEADDMFGAADAIELLAEFDKQGFFDDDREQLAQYKANPQLFIDETKSGFRHAFITFARECGYL